MKQLIDLGETGMLPLEVYIINQTSHLYVFFLQTNINNLSLLWLQIRFLHDPSKDTGYVGGALSSNMIRFFKNSDETWGHEASLLSFLVLFQMYD